MVDDFKWPQVWTTNLAIDHRLPFGMLGTVEFLYGKDIAGIKEPLDLHVLAI